MSLLTLIKPTFWFSAHLHVKYPALYLHDTGQSSAGKGQSSDIKSQNSTDENQFTKFLSLNKCLPGKSCLQIIDVATETDDKPYKLTYDLEWLTILRTTEQFMKYDKIRWSKPSDTKL